MPVATRAAAAALHEAAHADVLDLVLANVLPSLHQREVCALLCTSAATAAAVTRNGSGRLAVSAALSTPAQSQSLSRWLVTHSRLLRSLEVSSSVANLQGPFEVLPRLTGLRSLKLSQPGLDGEPPAALAAAVRPLTQLTELELEGVSMPWQSLSEFPASLQRLVVRCVHGLAYNTRGNLQLGHLTALTELDLGYPAWLCGGDVLPPNLVRLHRVWQKGVDVLKGLSSLRQLGGLYRVDELLAFAAAGLMAQLTYVGLSHCCRGGEDWGLGDMVKRLTDAGVAGAVRSVELIAIVCRQTLSPATLAALKQLPVQSLRCVDVKFELSTLTALTQLSRLDVQNTHFTSNASGYAALEGELLSLPSLRELVISHRDVAAHDAFLARVAQSSPQLLVVWWW